MPFFKRCACCHKMIAFGGKWHEGNPFCDWICAEKHAANKRLSAMVDAEEVMRRVEIERNQNCPHCDGPGPIDLYPTSESIGLVFVVQTTHRSYIACQKCGIRFQQRAISRTLLGAFLGFPVGWFIGALTIMHNHREIKRSKEPGPSERYIDYVKQMMCEEMAFRDAQSKNPTR